MTVALKKIGVGHFKANHLALEYTRQVLASGRLSYGPFTKRLETRFAGDHEASYGLFMNSGTSALHIALQALKIKHSYPDNSLVIVPSTTFVATINVILHNGLRPLFVDVDPRTYTLDPKGLEKTKERHPVAMIPVHLCGLPAQMDQIMEFAKSQEIQVIEDSCEAMYCEFNGQKVGSFGDIGCFSTYMAHIMTTGVGGFAITSDEELNEIMRSLMNHGRDSDYTDIDAPGKPSNRFKFHHAGHSFRATEMEAALGMAQIDYVVRSVEERQRNAKKLTEGLSSIRGLILPKTPSDRTHSWMMYPLAVRENKAELITHLELNGIETRDLLPILGQPVYEDYWELDDPAQFKVSRYLVDNAFYIGCHPGLTNEDIARIVAVFKDFYK